MQTYFVRRRGIAAGANELQEALSRLLGCEDALSRLSARWLHSYALSEADERYGLACVFRADSVEALRRHAELARLPAAEILPVVGTLLLRPFVGQAAYLVRRRGLARDLASPELPRAAPRGGGDPAASAPARLRSYAVREDDGLIGSVCLYQGRPGAAREARPDDWADEIRPVVGRIVYREEA